MSEPLAHETPPVPPPAPKMTLLRFGGYLGAAATFLVFLLFTIGCFGFKAAFHGAPVIALGLGAIGLLLTLVGGLVKRAGDEDTHVLFGLFASVMGILGALLEIAVWKNWDVFR